MMELQLATSEKHKRQKHNEDVYKKTEETVINSMV
jgi:hypothetical protein